MSLPSVAEVEHADWPALQRICGDLGLNPKGRSAVVRMRVLDFVRRRVRSPSWQPAREHQAALLTRLGHPDLAERVWESTIQLDAPAPWVGLGQAQLAGGFLSEAMRSFSRSTQMGDPSAELHRAEALAAGGDLDGAARACEAFLAAHPADVRALAMRRDFLARGGFVDEAIKVLQTAVELHADVPGLARTFGVALLRVGRHGPAEEAFQEATRRDPRDVDAVVGRGAALLLGGRTREAVDVLKASLKLDPKRADALNSLGIAYLTMGRTRPAVATLKKAAKQMEEPRIVLNLARAFEAAHEPSQALRAYDQAARLRPNDPQALAGHRRAVRAIKSEKGPEPSPARPAKKQSRPPRKHSPTSDPASPP